VRCLGLEEMSICKGHKHFAVVLSGLERHCILAVLPGRIQNSLEFFWDGLEDRQRKSIRLVAMDKWGPIAVSRKPNFPMWKLLSIASPL